MLLMARTGKLLDHLIRNAEHGEWIGLVILLLVAFAYTVYRVLRHVGR
jgi:hypothetical protein